MICDHELVEVGDASNKKSDDRATTTKGEAELWRATLGELYGEDWTE